MRDIPDYTEFVPDWVWRYYEQSGDTAVLAASYDRSKSIANYVQTQRRHHRERGGPGLQPARRDQLLPVRHHRLAGADALRLHVHQQRARARSTTPRRSARCAATAKVARALGKPEDAAALRRLGGRAERRRSTTSSLRPDGLYTDGLSSAAGNPQIDNTAQHAQTYPLYYGVAPAANRAALLDKITAQGMNQGPMTWHVLLKALADNGRYDQVVKLLTDENADGPARTLAQQGTFMWEQWNPGCATTWPCNPTNNESMSHGWGSWGIVDMIESLLGIQVTAPGAATVRIAPPAVGTADLHRVSAAPPGRSAARSRRPGARSTARYVLDVDVPANVKATVAIPNPGGRSSTSASARARRARSASRTAVPCSRSAPARRTSASASTGPAAGRRHGPGHAVASRSALRRRSARSRRASTKEYTAATTANVISTAGDAALSVSDPGHLTNGAFTPARAAAGRVQQGQPGPRRCPTTR